MKRTLTFVLAFSVLVPCGGQDRNRLLNDDWRFVRDSLAGAEAARYDDAAWKTVDLPHDFSLEPLPAGPNTLGPFSRETKGGRSVGYLPGGTGWYRKDFSLDKTDAGKSVSLVFDGAYMLTDVWVNGRKAAAHKNGYTPFAFDVTELLNPAGQENVLAVRVVNYGKNSRWYSGSGLYRDVELVVTDPLHVSQWGTRITTPEVSDKQATVNVEVNLSNARKKAVKADVSVRIFDCKGGEVAASTAQVKVSGKADVAIPLAVAVKDPSLWSPDSPTLYISGN